VAAPFVLSGNGKESFNPILDPDAGPDHHQNLITPLSWDKSNLPWQFRPNPHATFCV